VTAPQRTPNPATVERPERSSRRVARKSPLGWLPWALLGLIGLLLLLALLAYNAIDDDGAEGPAGDSLGQVSGEDGESAVGSDGGGSTSPGGGAGAPAGADSAALARLTETALVGGGAVAPGRVQDAAGAQALAGQPGTAGTVLFAEGSAEIDEAGQQVVSAAATALREAGATTVTVVGHTDVIAGEPVNDTLSQERADAVAAALGQQLPGVRITTAARGQDEPVADNATEQGRQLNRRAVITATA
jgi:OOP family OmpA-OmpF porin